MLNNLYFKHNIVSYFVYFTLIMKIVSNEATAEFTVVRLRATYICSAYSALYNTNCSKGVNINKQENISVNVVKLISYKMNSVSDVNQLYY